MPRFDGEYPVTTRNKPKSAVARPVKLPPHPTPQIEPQAAVASPEGQERACQRHPLKSGRSFTPSLRSGTDHNIVLRSENLIIPWHRFEYPGRKNGLVEAFGGGVKWTTMRGWQKNGKAPVWALRVYERLIEDRMIKCAEGLAQLRAEIHRLETALPKSSGFAMVGPNGTDKRGSGGRNRKHLGGTASKVAPSANPTDLPAAAE